MSKNILLLVIIIAIVLAIGITVYYLSQDLSQGVTPGVPEEEEEEEIVPKQPGEGLSEEKLKKMYPDFIEGTIKIEKREMGGESIERFALLTKDEKTFLLIPSSEGFYERNGIKKGDKVEIQGILEESKLQGTPPPNASAGHFIIGLITKK